jgi:dethiobiotin synthetase
MLSIRRTTTTTITIRSTRFITTPTRKIVVVAEKRQRLHSSLRQTYNASEQQQQQQQQQHEQQSKSTLRPIYVSATRQHVGKTSTCLALLSGLQKRFDKVGFMKPVGQISLTVPDDEQGDDNSDNNNNVIHVDKDAALIKQHFQLDHVTYRQSNPVLIPKGYTRDYLNGHITQSQQRQRILDSYHGIVRKISSNGVVLCEGTGHVAVGSIIDASNAQVASWLNARMILVANGGLGHSMDELELNKVKPEKYEQTKHYITKALEQKWGPGAVPLIGCIPDRLFLGCPALADIERLLKGSKLVSGREHLYRHYTVGDGAAAVASSVAGSNNKGNNLQLVSTSLEVFLKDVRRDTGGRTLYVSHASRNDILLGFLMESQNRGTS